MDGDDVRVRLLGPIDVTVGGAARAVTGVRRQAVLAALALHPGETVSAGRISDIVWGEARPATAANTLQSHISHLRGVLGARHRILARPPGYRLDLRPDGTDVLTAERLIDEARRTSEPTETARVLRTALALWRGDALADVLEMPWLRDQADRIDRLRRDAAEALIDARLALGEHEALVSELYRLVEEQPFHEHRYAQLMLALYRCGRQADALAAYQRLRIGLRDDLGLDPGAAIRELEAAILRQDTTLDPPRTAVTAHPVPEQLPAPLSAFTGREDELSALDAAAVAGGTLLAVSGTAGVGKTALAVQWAHQGVFPDGRLFVNLRGFHPGGPLDPADAVRGFLEALGVPADRQPSGLDARVSLWRSVSAGRRMLVVVDNARDAEQVRPLLPGGSGPVVLVTSRHQLAGLVAADGAVPVALGTPTAGEARDMFVRRIGAPRAADAPEAVDAMVERCARLPLALAITAARVAVHPELPLPALAADLDESDAGLDPFRGDDSATDVRAVFSWSYRTLSEPAALLFRAFGLHPGPDLSLSAAASLAGVPPREVRAHIAELTRGSLLIEHVPGRYRMHDLLCLYAGEQAHRLDSAETRAAAQRRLVDHYLHTAYAATMLLTPRRHPIALSPACDGVTVAALGDPTAAMDWFIAEHANLLAVVTADEPVCDERIWRLAWTLTTYLERRGHWPVNTAVQHGALRAATRCGDPLGQAYAHRNLGTTHTRFGDHATGIVHFGTARPLFETAGERIMAAHTSLGLAWAVERQGDPALALTHIDHAMVAYRATGDRVGLANALNAAGHCRNELGDFADGLASCVEALGIFREIGDRTGEAGTLDSLGYVHFRLGDSERGVAAYRSAIDLYRALGDRYNEADAYANLADSHAVAGERAAARVAWRVAADMLTQLNHPDSAEIERKLAE
ncbi:MAG TPA: BTAD domain-containing putative transcriptional regulator [Micromonosporaceae bacterium]